MSRRDYPQPAFTVGRKCEAGANVFSREVREIRKNLIDGHSGREVFKDILNSHTESANARLSAAFVRIDSDQVFVVHS